MFLNSLILFTASLTHRMEYLPNPVDFFFSPHIFPAERPNKNVLTADIVDLTRQVQHAPFMFINLKKKAKTKAKKCCLFGRRRRLKRPSTSTLSCRLRYVSGLRNRPIMEQLPPLALASVPHSTACVWTEGLAWFSASMFADSPVSVW